jgi:septal ring factor EnvC (AmiA/AmiB activator)
MNDNGKINILCIVVFTLCATLVVCTILDTRRLEQLRSTLADCRGELAESEEYNRQLEQDLSTVIERVDRSERFVTVIRADTEELARRNESSIVTIQDARTKLHSIANQVEILESRLLDYELIKHGVINNYTRALNDNSE